MAKRRTPAKVQPRRTAGRSVPGGGGDGGFVPLSRTVEFTSADASVVIDPAGPQSLAENITIDLSASGGGAAPAAPSGLAVTQAADTLAVSFDAPPAPEEGLPADVGAYVFAGPVGGALVLSRVLTPDDVAEAGATVATTVGVGAVGDHVVRVHYVRAGALSPAAEAAITVEGGAPGSGPNALPDVVLETPVVGSQQVAWPFQVSTDGRVEAVGAEITMTAEGLPDRTLPLAIPVLPGTRVLLPFRPPPEYRRAVVVADIEPAPRETAAYVAATEAVLIPDQGTGAYLTDENGTPFVFTPA